MSWNTLNTQLYTLINNNKETLGIQEVYSYPKLNFSGYPSCSFYPSDNENDYETTSENLRIYAWKCRLFDEMKDQGIEESMGILRPVIDDMIDIIDQEDEKDSGRIVGIDLPDRYTFINILPVPTAWGQTNDENLLFSEINIRIKISVDITT